MKTLHLAIIGISLILLSSNLFNIEARCSTEDIKYHIYCGPPINTGVISSEHPTTLEVIIGFGVIVGGAVGGISIFILKKKK